MLLKIEPWLTSTLKLPPIVAYIIAAAISALTVSAIAAALFVRPRFEVEFMEDLTRQPSAGPAIELNVDGSKEIAAYQVSVKTSARYWLAGRMLRALGSGNSKLRVSLHPEDAVHMTPEFGGASAAVGSSSITFDLTGTSPGVWGSQVVTLEPGTGLTPVIDVQVNCDFVTGSRKHGLASKIAKIDMPVRSLKLRQIRRK
ncbi:hypothetical protein [Cellulosimicrobium cellulans]|uniref:hypothetical protein n=1 Tax=Cellulosimicrobium cellulans TaxID=1710 RepID=UPI0028AE85A3|nr:hypothetical protein [Cellulosimicrobium cellulans]